MGHMPVGGEDGTLAALSGLRATAHLDPHQQYQSDPDRGFAASARMVEAAGFEVAEDGMEIVL